MPESSNFNLEEQAQAHNPELQTTLHELHQQSTNILESITDAFFALDRNWHFTYVNPQAEQLLQRTRDELLGQNIWDMCSEAVGTTFYQEYHRAITQKITVRFEEFYPPLNTWFEVRAYPANNGLSVYFLDISDRKQAEEALYQREQSFRALAENAPDTIVRLDKQLRHLYVNPKVETVTGLSPEAIIGKTARELGFLKAHCNSWEEICQQVFTTGREYDFEFDARTPDGTTRYFQSRLVPEFALDGSVETIMAITRDMTDSRQTEAALRESQQLLQAILDAAPTRIYLKDLQGRYILVNRCCEDDLGLNLEQVIGKTDGEVWLQENADSFRASDRAVLEAGTPLEWEQVVSEADGLRTFSTTKFPLYDAAGTPYAIGGISIDITDRKRAEEALYQREQEFKALAENSPEIITRLDKQLRYLYVNAAVESVTGISPQDHIGKTNRDLELPEAICTCWEENLQQVFITGQERIIEFDYTTLDGTTRYYQTRLVPEFAKEGSVETILTIDREVTNFKQTEAALRESQQLLQAILDAAPARIYLKDLQGRYILVNRYCSEDALGVTAEQRIGKTDDELFPPEIADAFQAHDRAALEGGMPVELEEVLAKPDGLHTFITTKFPLYDTTGVPYAVCGISTDITERKQMEAALHESEERFRQFAENIDAVFWMRSVDEQLNKQEFLYLSPAYEKIWGRTRERLYEQPESWLDAIHSEDLSKLMARIEQQRQGEFPLREYRIVLPDGSIRWIQDRTFPIENAEGRVYRIAGIAEDITERKQAEEQLKASLQEKEALLKEVHHRVKNNLQIISSLLDLQSQQLQDAIALEAFRASQNRIKSIALIHEKLYHSENLARVNLADYIHTLTTYLLQTYLANLDRITLQVNIEDICLSVDTLIPCGLIINELVSNALKYAFPGNRAGEIGIDFAQTSPNQYVLTVRDNGMGLPEDINLRQTSTLGLQLVWTLTQQLHGSIELERTNGSAFKISFKGNG